MRSLAERIEIPVRRIVGWLRITGGDFPWRDRYGEVNERNGWIPGDHWLEPWEREAIVEYCHQHPLDGCRQLTFMMDDRRGRGGSEPVHGVSGLVESGPPGSVDEEGIAEGEGVGATPGAA